MGKTERVKYLIIGNSAGGIGTAWSKLRATGAYIKTAGITSQGTIPFLKIANDVFSY